MFDLGEIGLFKKIVMIWESFLVHTWEAMIRIQLMDIDIDELSFSEIVVLRKPY